MTLSTLTCILTVLVGCYVFLYLAGKQEEVEAKDRKIGQWSYEQAMEKEERRRGKGNSRGGRTASPPPTSARQPLGNDATNLN
ncbi:MAG: hypothetical protein JXQ73_12770 [Phycisphaerae bacterium]|nr:hypothetical protein [Phycisphaerae bacterium]